MRRRREHERNEPHARNAKARAVELEEPHDGAGIRIAVHGAHEGVVATKLAQVQAQGRVDGTRTSTALLNPMGHKHERLARALRMAGVERAGDHGKVCVRGEQRLGEHEARKEKAALLHRARHLGERGAKDKMARLHQHPARAGAGQRMQRLGDVRHGRAPPRQLNCLPFLQ